MNLIDCHTHSTLSHDGCDEPMLMAQRACELGIKHFALTDHIEIDKFTEWDFESAVSKGYGVFREIKERFAGKMEVYYGAELGQPLYNLPLAEKILGAHDFDFVLGSQHRSKSYPYLNRVPDTYADRKRCLDEYFEEELALAKWGNFCSLSHLTFPLRFLQVDIKAPVLKICREIDMSPYESTIDEIFRTIIKRGIALEVNSSGIRKGLGVPMPPQEYLLRYKRLGGRLITIGSDAHRVSDVGADIENTMNLLREIGFSEICVYKYKEPIFIGI